jgi:NAD+ kinase
MTSTTLERPGTPPHVSVVVKQSSWRRWVDEEADPRILALLDTDDETVRRMRASHVDHTETIEEVRAALDELGARASWYDRPHDFCIEGRCDLVVTVGGDGTLLGASHGIGTGVPLLGVNSAPAHSVGFFCGAIKGEARPAIAAALAGTLPATALTRMSIDVNGRRLFDRVLNECLFCHVSPAGTSRYLLRRLDAAGRSGAAEEHKSSGVWVGPPAGSTAAQQSAGGRVLPLSSRTLQYVVREAYRPHGEALALTSGLIEEGEALAIKSKMRTACLFADGDHIVAEVTMGDIVEMRSSAEPLLVLGLGSNGRRRQELSLGTTRG